MIACNGCTRGEKMLQKIKSRCINNLRTARMEVAAEMQEEPWFDSTLAKLDEVIYQVEGLKGYLRCADCGLESEVTNMPPEGWEFVDDSEAGGATYWLCRKCACV